MGEMQLLELRRHGQQAAGSGSVPSREVVLCPGLDSIRRRRGLSRLNIHGLVRLFRLNVLTSTSLSQGGAVQNSGYRVRQVEKLTKVEALRRTREAMIEGRLKGLGAR
jgi:hypothetical protein